MFCIILHLKMNTIAKWRLLISSFFTPHFNHCSFIWMFQRYLHIVYNDNRTSFKDLLYNHKKVSIHLKNVQTLAGPENCTCRLWKPYVESERTIFWFPENIRQADVFWDPKRKYGLNIIAYVLIAFIKKMIICL